MAETRGRWWEAGAVPPAAVPAMTPTPPPAPQATPTAPSPTPEERCSPDVLDAEPAVPFDVLGLVEVQSRAPGDDPSSVVASAKLEACRIGGDALVVLFRDERRGGIRTGGGGSTVLPSPALRAAVIRYRR